MNDVNRPPLPALAIMAAGAALLADATFETMRSGSRAGWWVLATLALYFAVSGLTWRRRFGWDVRLTIALACVLGPVAATAWLPGGLTSGVRLLGQATAVVLSGATVAALLIAVAVWGRATALPLPARAAGVLLAVYATAAFVLGAGNGTAYPALFAGESAWRSAPRFLQGAMIGGLVVLPLSLLVCLAGGLRRGARGWRSVEIVALGLSVVMVISGFTNAAGLDYGRIPAAMSGGAGPGSDPAPAAALSVPSDQATVAAFRDSADRIQAASAASDFNLDKKAAELGPDIGRLFTFVRQEIRSEIYAGVLRGAPGTLAARAGNAWDRAALLAALLARHGREVRFAHAHLPPEQAAALVAGMFSGTPGQIAALPSVSLAEAVVAAGRDLAAKVQTDWHAAERELFDAIDRSGVALGSTQPVPEATLAREASDHVWVEYRDGDRFVPLDPVAADRPGVAVAPASETFAEIPEAFQHRVSFHVKVEQRQNQKLEERDVFLWSTTSAALNGVGILLAHQISHTLTGDWQATPTLFVDHEVYSAMSFTEHGVVAAEKSSTGSELIDQARKVTKEAPKEVADLFGGQAQAPAASVAAGSELTGVALEVEFTDPGGHVETARRELLDRVGRVARAQGTAATAPLSPMPVAAGVPVALAALYGCAVTSGPLDARQPLARLGSTLPILDDAIALRGIAGTPGRTPTPEEQARVKRVVGMLPSMLEGAAQLMHVLSDQLGRRLQLGQGLLFSSTRLRRGSPSPVSTSPAAPWRSICAGTPCAWSAAGRPDRTSRAPTSLAACSTP